MTRESLYEQLGGAPAIAALVDRFYARLHVDSQVRHLFSAERAERVMDAQRQYFAAMLGGPSDRFGADLAAELAAAHRDVTIEDHHIVLVLEHLRAALVEAGASAALTDRVVAVAMRLWWARRWN